ncbi:hypothetical protein NQ315_017486 [Exocentrus adspersus]|uniref:LAGLIDADG homing endonuclease n=1 Tax=Exocentrus adspersus TaxID=1586481 RepID=A0AAV8VKP9_9CUCU|nr:hypothetical protein NQ315_017486 [Exocentrus adspersus]
MGLYGACRSDELYKLEIVNVDDQKSEVGVLDIIRKYIGLRPKNVPHKKFFISYRQKKCTVQLVGINTLYKVPNKLPIF